MSQRVPRTSRRHFLRRGLAATAAVGLLAAGCGPTAPAAGPTTQPAGGAAAPAAPAKELTIRLNHAFGKVGAVATAAEKFQELVQQRSSDRIKVQTFHSAELGAEKEMYDALSTGAVEMLVTGSLIVATLAPQFGAIEMPYLFKSQKHFRSVVDGPIGEEMHQEFLTKRGNRVLAVMNRSARHLTTKNREVNTPADLRGLKIRTLENPIHVEAWRALGASPVPMAFPEVFTALQQGTLDAQENPYDVTFANSFYDVQKYLMQTGHVRSGTWMNISDTFWQSLTADDQKLIAQAAKDAGLFSDQENDKLEADFAQKLKEKGMVFVEPDLQPFRDGVKDVPAKFKDTWKPGLIEEIQKLEA